MRNDDLQKIILLRHELHKYPELSGREAETGRRLRHFLRENTSLEIVKRDGWFFAVKEGADPNAGSIAFRADMDALPMEEEIDLPYASVYPGIAHKCGHDGHCAVLCGFALELDRIKTDKTVYLIFQKAEETGEGGKFGAELIREKGIGEVYAFHNRSGYPEGAVFYRRGLTQPASEGLEICFYGKESHASAPEDGINPAGVIAEMVQFAEQFREAPHGGTAQCTIVGLRAGKGDFGISAGEGFFRVTLRAETDEGLQEMETRICSFAEKMVSERGIRTKKQVFDRFPETRNSETGIEKVLRAAEELNVPAVEMPVIWRASEDFGHYLKECSGAMFYIGNGEKWPAVHTAEYDFNDRILERAVDLFMGLISM